MTKKMIEYIGLENFEEFKSYARKMLTDVFNAKVTPYCNNEKMQEVTIAWDASPKAKFGDYPPENMTHIVSEPYKNPLDIGSYAFKEMVGILMEQVGLRPNTSPFVSGARKGQFAINMRHGSDGQSSTISMFHLRANGDLAMAQEYFKKLDNKALDAACREALGKYHYGVSPS